MKTYVVPVSGGKDSQAVTRWALENHDKSELRFVHQYTGYDHPLTYEHLKYMEQRYGISIEFTKSAKYSDVFDFIEKAGYFPGSLARGCTSELKQYPFGIWLRENDLLRPDACCVYMGMRSDEGRDRQRKYGGLSDDDVFYLNELSSKYNNDFRHVEIRLPIVTWTYDEVMFYLQVNDDKVNDLYAKGHKRVGCYPCLLSNNHDWELASQDPVGREHIRRLIEIEDKFVRDKNPRKLIKIHPTRNVRALYEKGQKCDPVDDTQCGWCSI